MRGCFEYSIVNLRLISTMFWHTRENIIGGHEWHLLPWFFHWYHTYLAIKNRSVCYMYVLFCWPYIVVSCVSRAKHLSIIGGPALETCQSLCMYNSTKNCHAQYWRYVMTSPYATVTATDIFYLGRRFQWRIKSTI